MLGIPIFLIIFIKEHRFSYHLLYQNGPHFQNIGTMVGVRITVLVKVQLSRTDYSGNVIECYRMK